MVLIHKLIVKISKSLHLVSTYSQLQTLPLRAIQTSYTEETISMLCASVKLTLFGVLLTVIVAVVLPVCVQVWCTFKGLRDHIFIKKRRPNVLIRIIPVGLFLITGYVIHIWSDPSKLYTLIHWKVCQTNMQKLHTWVTLICTLIIYIVSAPLLLAIFYKWIDLSLLLNSIRMEHYVISFLLNMNLVYFNLLLFRFFLLYFDICHQNNLISWK